MGHDVSVCIVGTDGIDSLMSIMQDATVQCLTPAFRQRKTPMQTWRNSISGHVDSLPGFLVALAAVNANIYNISTYERR